MRVGIVGYGRWAPNLARNLAKHATIAWVADPSEAAQARAREAGYVSCNSPMWNECDAVAIATPIATHFNITRHAIGCGKHVLCEKPLSTKASEVAWFRSVGIGLGPEATKIIGRHHKVMMSAPWLYHPAIQRAGEVARDLGAPLWFRATRTSWDERPLEPIADLLPHDVGILKAWTGQRVAEVSAVVEGPTASVTLRTDGGVVGTIQYSYRDRSKARHTELGCEGGSVSYDGFTFGWSKPEFAEAVRTRSDSAYRYESFGGSEHPEPLDAMCAEFVDCCREGRTPRFGNIDDALHVAEVIEAAHRSVSGRRVVTL